MLDYELDFLGKLLKNNTNLNRKELHKIFNKTCGTSYTYNTFNNNVNRHFKGTHDSSCYRRWTEEEETLIKIYTENLCITGFSLYNAKATAKLLNRSRESIFKRIAKLKQEKRLKVECYFKKIEVK